MVALAVPAAAPAAVSHARPATAVPDISRPILTGKQLPAPLTTTECLAQIGINCYTPVQYRTAYNLNPLYARGDHRPGPDDRDRQLLRLAHDPPTTSRSSTSSSASRTPT